MALRLDLQPGDVLRIGTGTVLRIESKSGSRTRVSIESEYRVQKESGKGTAPSRPDPNSAPPAPGAPLIPRPR